MNLQIPQHSEMFRSIDEATRIGFKEREVKLLSRGAERHGVTEWLGSLETQKPGVRVFISVCAWQQSDLSYWIQSATAVDNLAGTDRKEAASEQLWDSSRAYYAAHEVISWAMKYAENAASEPPDANMLLPGALPKSQLAAASSSSSLGNASAESSHGRRATAALPELPQAAESSRHRA